MTVIRHIATPLLFCVCFDPLGKTAWSLALSCSSVHRRQAPPVHRRQAPPAGHPFTRVPDINTEPTNHTHTHTNTMLAGFSAPGFVSGIDLPLDGRRLQAIQLFGHGPSTHSLCTHTVPGVVLQCSGKSRTLALTVRGACTSSRKPSRCHQALTRRHQRQGRGLSCHPWSPFHPRAGTSGGPARKAGSRRVAWAYARGAISGRVERFTCLTLFAIPPSHRHEGGACTPSRKPSFSEDREQEAVA